MSISGGLGLINVPRWVLSKVKTTGAQYETRDGWLLAHLLQVMKPAFSLGLTGNSFGCHSFDFFFQNTCIPAVVVLIVVNLSPA